MAIQKMRMVSEEKDVGQDPVLDKDLTTAPGSPSEGDRYIIAGTGGNWSTGTINDIAHYTSSAWTFLTPTKGMEVYADDEDSFYHWNGSAWTERVAGGGGSGDMTKAVYDVDNNSIVDKAEMVDDGINSVTALTLVKNLYNVMLNAFRIAINGSLTQFNMIDGIVDEYEDESGVDTDESTNENYDSVNDFYEPGGSGGLPSSEYSSDTDTKLLLHLNNNVTVSSGTKKFGSDSAYFNGTNAYLTTPDSTDWDFDGDFTIELWVKADAGGNPIARIFAFGVNEYKSLQLFANGLIYYDTYNFSTISIGDLRDDTWHHIAIVRYGTGSNNVKGYVDGIEMASLTTNDTMVSASGLKMGQWWGAGDRFFKGYIDEFRVLKGVARWTANFNVLDRDNMTLISNSFIADTEPDNARIVLFEEDVDSVTLNTDLKAYASRDGGTTFTQITLADEGDYETGKQILTGSVDISGQPSGTSMEYKIETLNEKNLKLHGTALAWS